MQQGRKRLIPILLVLTLLVAVAVPTSQYFLYRVLENRLRTGIEALGTDSLSVNFDSIYSDRHREMLIIQNLSIRSLKDDECPSAGEIVVNEIRIQGFRLLPYLLERTLAVERIIINDLSISFQASRGFDRMVAKNNHKDVRLRVDELRLNAVHLIEADSTSCQLSRELRTNLVAAGLVVDIPANEQAHMACAKVRVKDTEIALEPDLYKIGIASASFDQKAGKFHADTITIRPRLSKAAFAKHVGYELDRVEGTLPFLHVEGLKFPDCDSLSIQVEMLRMQGFMKFFRDKRYPHKSILKPMPQDLLKRLPFGLRIDSLRIVNSYVEYEEYAEKAVSPGKIYFDGLSVQMTSISNHSDTMMNVKASARFLGSSEARLDADLNLKGGVSSATGTLRGLSLEKLNAIVEPMAAIKIESGQLHELTFNFLFNDFRSDGTVTLNYENLRMTSMHKDERKKEKGKKDNIETFILNTFVIKTNMTTDLPRDKRTGTILNQRDKSRSIFNYWWKSVFAGIKSAMNIEGKKK